MDSSTPLRTVEPRPITPGAPYYNASRGHAASEPQQIGLRLGPESQIPDHPSSVMDVPRASNGYGRVAPSTLPAATDVAQLKSQCQYNLREYQALLRRRQHPGGASTASVDLEARLRSQHGIVLANLRLLQDEVKVMVKAAENHRWRKWLLGGAIASFIPLVRKIFRRGSDEESVESSNDTEYAFKRSQGIVSRIKDSVLGKGGFAGVAFFVFAVLYVFQNEVSLRVAKTVQKRVKRLTARVERGDPDIDDRDIKMLQGWRWRVLLW